MSESVENHTREHRSYDFSNPVSFQALSEDQPLWRGLTSTGAFERLRSIRFLGGIDYVLKRAPNGARGNVRYTRHQHSLGVARLALVYCLERKATTADRRLAFSAALLHDLGHPPLSHSLEPVFRDRFGLEHHGATEDIVCGRVPMGREVYDVLRANDVDVERLVAIITGADTSFDGFFSGPINFDTIEGILRSRAFVRPSQTMLGPENVTRAALWRASECDRITVDAFWLNKHEIYTHVINSEIGVLADFACQLWMRMNIDSITADDYFSNEEVIFKKLGGLRDLLRSPSFRSSIVQHARGPISYIARSFFVDESTDFFSRNDRERYRQTKEQRWLNPINSGMVEAVAIEQDFFDDGYRSG
jgi:uncharacterized protein